MRIPTWRLAAVTMALAMSLRASAQGAIEEAPAAVPEPVAAAMMRLAAAGPEDRLVFLGPGDGRTVIAAALRSGVKTSLASTDPFSADLSGATVIALDIPEQAAARLRPLLLILRPGTRVVSPEAHFGDWKPDRTVAVGQANAHLWTVPANLTGNWCGQDAASGAVLRLDQRFQEVEGEFRKATKSLRFEGRIEGTRIAGAAGRLALEQSGDVLRVTIAQGNYAAYRFASFARTCCGTCP
ncbi:MAG: hypothetical protein NDI88_02940 [Lysobacter sp.]|nr:hypothetical protein [Lysobacter sp.]